MSARSRSIAISEDIHRDPMDASGLATRNHDDAKPGMRPATARERVDEPLREWADPAIRVLTCRGPHACDNRGRCDLRPRSSPPARPPPASGSRWRSRRSGKGKRPPVRRDHQRLYVPQHRRRLRRRVPHRRGGRAPGPAGLKAGDQIEVILELDTGRARSRSPPDFAAALDADPAAKRASKALVQQQAAVTIGRPAPSRPRRASGGSRSR